jgi:hypothetical protein
MVPASSSSRHRTSSNRSSDRPTKVRDDQHRFLSLLGQLPARLTAEQTAWILNCPPHDVPLLVTARLLKPLGNPASNSTKFFSSAEILDLAKDRQWLAKATNPIGQHWQRKNARKSAHSPIAGGDERPTPISLSA